MAIWAFSVFGLRASPTLEGALPFQRAAVGFGTIGAVLYYHFTVLLTRPSASARSNRILVIGYLLVIVFAGLLPTTGNQMKFYGPAPVLGKAFAMYIVLLYFYVTLGIINLWKAARNSPNDLFPVLGMRIYPLGMIGNLLFCLFVGIAIVRHQLLDIKIMIRRGLAYGAASTIVIGTYVGLIFLVNIIFDIQRISLWANVTAMFLLAVILQPVLRKAQRMVDRLFYRERYNYLEALMQFSRETQSIANVQELGSNMVQLVTGALRTSSTCLLLPANQFLRVSLTPYLSYAVLPGLKNRTWKCCRVTCMYR